MRILHILIGNMNQGGIENNLMELYRHIDKEKIQFDFLVHSEENYYREEIEKMGGRIYVLPFKSKGLFNFIKGFKKILREHDEYSIVHIHTSYAIVALDACICHHSGIKNIIVQAHASNSNRIKQKVINKLLKGMLSYYSTVRLAVSKSAANWLFTKKVCKENNYILFNNSITVSKYFFNNDMRIKYRDEFHIDDQTVLLGSTGRLDKIKNFCFLIDIMKDLADKNEKFKLLLVGDGPEMDSLKQKVMDYNLEKLVIFTGNVKNINEILNAMDIFLFPSMYEGLGLSIIEAEINGLPCIINETLPEEVDISSSLVRLNVKKGIKSWVNKIQMMNVNRIKLEKDDFDSFLVENNSKILTNLYRGLSNE